MPESYREQPVPFCMFTVECDSGIGAKRVSNYEVPEFARMNDDICMALTSIVPHKGKRRARAVREPGTVMAAWSSPRSPLGSAAGSMRRLTLTHSCPALEKRTAPSSQTNALRRGRSRRFFDGLPEDWRYPLLTLTDAVRFTGE